MESELNLQSTALVVVDPQVDLLSPDGAAWDLFGEQVSKRDTVARVRELRDAAEAAGVPVFYSRIEVAAEDYESWTSRNGIQRLFAERRLFESGKGARFVERLAPTEKTILLSPRKGPSSVHSDMAEQLRRRGIDTIIIAGMVANLCVESHVRDATDDGFNAIVVGDAVATLSDEAHEATLGNFGLVATEVVATDDLVATLQATTA